MLGNYLGFRIFSAAALGEILGAAVFFCLGIAQWIVHARRSLARAEIAVEIKSFLGQNFTFDFYEALGQFDNYFFALADLEPERKVMLAVTQKAYNTFFSKKYVQRMLELKAIPVLVVDTDIETIVQWIK